MSNNLNFLENNQSATENAELDKNRGKVSGN